MVARLNAEFRKVLAMPDIGAKITELGGEVKAGSPRGHGGVDGAGDGRIGARSSTRPDIKLD